MSFKDIGRAYNRASTRYVNEWHLGAPIKNPLLKTGDIGSNEFCAVFIAPPGRTFRNGNQIFLTAKDIEHHLDVLNKKAEYDFRGPYIPNDIPKSLFEHALTGIEFASQNNVITLHALREKDTMQMAAQDYPQPHQG